MVSSMFSDSIFLSDRAYLPWNSLDYVTVNALILSSYSSSLRHGVAANKVILLPIVGFYPIFSHTGETRADKRVVLTWYPDDVC